MKDGEVEERQMGGSDGKNDEENREKGKEGKGKEKEGRERSQKIKKVKLAGGMDGIEEE